MKITAEIQQYINEEVSKKETMLEAKYTEHFDKLKQELYSTVREYAKESVSNTVKLESIDKSCDNVHYKPIIDGIVNLLNGNNIKVTLNEAQSNLNNEESEAKSLLMEAVKTIQDLRDMITIHEMIESSLTGMNKDIIKKAVDRFKNDERFHTMKKEDFLKEVAEYIMNFKGDSSPIKPVQYESININKELDEADKLLEATDANHMANDFKPKATINIPSLKKTVLDEAYAINSNPISSNDPVQEFMDNWG